jgi:hypothetical protein
MRALASPEKLLVGILGLFRVLMLLDSLLFVVMMMLVMLRLVMVVMMMMMMMVMAFDPDALALAASPLLLVVARAQSPSILLIPCAQGLAAKCEVVIFNDSGDHPWMVPEVDLADSWVRNVEVRDEKIGLGGPPVR